MPDPRLEPRDFVVALTVFYQDIKGQFYSTTFFNQTIEIVEKKKLIDTELLGMWAILAGIVAAIGEAGCGWQALWALPLPAVALAVGVFAAMATAVV